jgi:hypothetical protein
MKTKICTQCHKEKSITEFHKNPQAKDSYRNICKLCQNLNNRLKWPSRKEKYRENRITYRKQNKNKIYNWRKNQLKNNIEFRVLNNLRSRVNMALRNNQKSGHTLELLGCSIEFLKQHFESRFKEGMSWSNYGRGFHGKGMKEWHIDHIIPCDKFDLTDPKQQEQCFHYTNLRPMWAEENWIKNKY